MNKNQLIAVLVIGILFLSGCATAPESEQVISPDHPDFVWVKIISRPSARGDELVPSSTKGFRHMAIVSDILPHGIWEAGPDKDGKITTTDTVANLSEWQVHKVTQKCIELCGDYIKEEFVGVNRNGLLEGIKLYESAWVGQKYSRYSQNENYAVDTVIYSAGGNIHNAKPSPQN
jgi:hypothetical protein